MKRFLFLIIIILISGVLAENQLSVRFHSFGKNTTIDLKEFLGESEQYIASQSSNIRVIIDQEAGIASLYARPGWVGSETIVFTSIEKAGDIINQTLLDMLKTAEEFKYTITEKELDELTKDNIDKEMKMWIRGIEQEEIKNIYAKIENKELLLNLNDEINFNINLNEEKPRINMEFKSAKDSSKTIVIPDIKEKFDMSWVLIPTVIILSLIGIAFIISKREHIKESFGKIDQKRKTIRRLKNIKEYDKESSREFLKISNNFFSNFFNLRYNFEYDELKGKVKKSNLSVSKKIKIISFINKLSEIMFYSNTEKWAKIYGKGTIPPDKLKRLIKKLIGIIKKI